MRRNRRQQSTEVRFSTILTAFVLCLLIGGSGVGYVWQKNQIYALGQQIKKSELRFEELRRQNKRLGEQLASLRLPGALDARVRELNLGLGPPQPEQIVHLPDPLPGTETQLAPKPDTERAIRQVARR